MLLCDVVSGCSGGIPRKLRSRMRIPAWAAWQIHVADCSACGRYAFLTVFLSFRQAWITVTPLPVVQALLPQEHTMDSPPKRLAWKTARTPIPDLAVVAFTVEIGGTIGHFGQDEMWERRTNKLWDAAGRHMTTWMAT